VSRHTGEPRTVRILIVEDSPDDAELALHELQAAGLEPDWRRVDDEPSFLAALADGVDAITSDLDVPGFDGLRALELRNQLAPDTPFIVVSGKVSDDHAALVLAQGATDYILKDRMGRLGQAVARAIEERRTEEARSQAEQAEADIRDRWETLVRNSTDILFMVDAEGIITFANASLISLLGGGPDDILGRGIGDYAHPDDIEAVSAGLVDAIEREGVAVPIAVRLRSSDGWHYLEGVANSRLTDPTIQGIVLNSRDMTERVLAERLMADEAAILERIAHGEAPESVLADIAALAVGDSKDCRVSVSFDHEHYRHPTVVGEDGASPLCSIELDGTEVGMMTVHHAPGTVAPELDSQRVAGACRLAALVARHQIGKARLLHQGLHDPLTGLANRLLFAKQVDEALAAGDGVAVLKIGIDHFGVVNGGLGHQCGDRVLRGLAQRLAGLTSSVATIARVGGDEFAVLVEGQMAGSDAAALAERLLVAARDPLNLDGRELRVTVSIGIAHRMDADGRGSPLDDASYALARAKELGRNRVFTFDHASRLAIEDRIILEQDLRVGIARGELVCHLQPVVNLTTGEVEGAEALVRWQHPIRGLLMPSAFMPWADQSDLVEAVDAWMLEATCRYVAAPGPGQGLTVSVNAVARELVDEKFPLRVLATLKRHRVPTTCLVLEVTESAALVDVDRVGSNLAALRRAGVSIHLDDFGTGYSSLNYVHMLPIDVIKIDQSFVRDISTDHDGQPLVKTIVAMARALGLKTIAEGVESQSESDQLRAMGVDSAQGYLVCKPCSFEEFDRWLGQAHTVPSLAS
jgi:diguanylate cyclase (GGDEF)-like protein/PAS domain S-box-containing protein